MNPEDEERLQSYIHDRTYNIINDNNTFLWSKTEHGDALNSFNKSGEYLIGGGNLSSGILLFLVLVYLSKFYWILTGRFVVTETQEQSAKKFYENIPYEIKNLFDYKHKNYINERKAFKVIVEDYGIEKLGIEHKKDVHDIYDIIRNKSVHLLAPGGETKEKTVPMLSVGPIQSSSHDVIDTIKIKSIKAFTKGGRGLYECSTETLSLSVQEIEKWLIGKLPTFEIKNRKKALVWITEELEK